MSKEKSGKVIIQGIIKVCNHSIMTDELGLREPICRSDTYMIRNTLQSMLKYGYIRAKGKDNDQGR